MPYRFAIPLSGRLFVTGTWATTMIGTYMGYIPDVLGGIASLVAIVWWTIQIYFFYKDRK